VSAPNTKEPSMSADREVSDGHEWNKQKRTDFTIAEIVGVIILLITVICIGVL